MKYRGGLKQHALRRAIDYIHTNLAQDLRLEDLASVVHMSPYHFSRLFHQSTGMAPHQYLKCERVARAKVLLADSAKPIVEIALAVGYATQAHFTTVFRKATGHTPKAYRDSR